MNLKKIILLAIAFSYGMMSLAQGLNLNLKNVSVKKAMTELYQKTGYSFVYEAADLNTSREVTVNATSLEKAIEQILAGQDVDYKIQGKNIIVSHRVSRTASAPDAKRHTVTGSITDSKGEPIIGASVKVRGTNLGTVTDIDGNFSMDVPEGSDLEISYVGFRTQTVKSPGKQVSVNLIEDTEALDEVVVIGYGSRQKKDITTSISNIDSKDIAKVVSMTPDMSMQGTMSGVQVIGNEGDPNARTTVRIRGINTWGISSPLYVIDGIPIMEYGAGVENDYWYRGNINILSMIDPNDIESISVLKDAASAAIYGLKASNGVILITTKKGFRNQVRVNYSQRIGFENQWQRVKPLMNTKQFVDFYNALLDTDENRLQDEDPSNKPFFDPSDPKYIGNGPTYDWQKASLTDNPMTQDYSVSINGGGKSNDYMASFSYADHDGVKLGNWMKRYSGALKLNADVNDYVRFGTNIRVAYGTSGNAPYTPSLIEAAQYSPWQPIYDENGFGGYAQTINGYVNGIWDTTTLYGTNTKNNFVGRQHYNYQDNSSLRMMWNAYLEIEPIKNLKLRGTIDMDRFTNSVNYFEYGKANVLLWNGVDPENSYAPGSVGDYNERSVTNTNFIYEFNASYKFTLYKKHNFDALFDITGQKFRMKSNSASTLSVASANKNLHVIEGENQYTNASTFQKREALAGFLFRLSYNYDQKYYVDATIRRDGSVRFARENRWGTFPGISAAWRISSERFMQKYRNWIDDIKIRVSWGQLGNQEVTSYAYLSRIGTYPNYVFGNNPQNVGRGYYSSGAAAYLLANSDLKWEKTTTSNFGIDFTFFHDFSGSIEYYHKLTSGILEDIKLAPSVGLVVQPSANIGSVRNTGIEINLNYSHSIKDFNFSVGGNFTTVRNRVVKIEGGSPLILSSSVGNIEKGKPMGYLRGYQLGGFFQTKEEAQEYLKKVNDVSYVKEYITAGDAWFKDINGAPKKEGEAYSVGPDGIVDSYDMTYLGKSLPGYFYGFNLSANWHNFNFFAQFSGVGDVQKVNPVKSTFLTVGAANTHTTDALNYWREDNKNALLPRLDAHFACSPGRIAWIEDADYLRLANIQLGYTLPQSVYKCTNYIVKNCNLYLGISNLFTITGYSGLDPEDDYNPAPRIYYMGLNLTF